MSFLLVGCALLERPVESYLTGAPVCEQTRSAPRCADVLVCVERPDRVWWQPRGARYQPDVLACRVDDHACQTRNRARALEAACSAR